VTVVQDKIQIRKNLSELLAKYFYYHLKTELTKSRELLDYITLEGISFEEITKQMILELEKEFPSTLVDKNYSYNLFEKWHNFRKDEGVRTYFETSFKLYNQVFFARIIDIRDHSLEAREKLNFRINRILGVGKAYGKDFTFGLFFSTENRMRETINELLIEEFTLDYKIYYDIFYEQSEYYTKKGFDHFDSVLKNSLKKTDDLLLNILPRPIAEELKSQGKSQPIYIPEVSVLFTDFTGFTKIAEKLSPSELIEELDICFREFDLIIEKYNLEKIKTIGDAYLCVGGIFESKEDHLYKICLAGIEIRNYIQDRKKNKELEKSEYWDCRIGIHTGAVVAGVIGEKRFAFDVWGDTVNTASRLESMSEPNKINVSTQVYEKMKSYFQLEYRGKFSPKNKKEIDMYFLIDKF
jgi:class 3 adenylate cyclase